MKTFKWLGLVGIALMLTKLGAPARDYDFGTFELGRDTIVQHPLDHAQRLVLLACLRADGAVNFAYAELPDSRALQAIQATNWTTVETNALNEKWTFALGGNDRFQLGFNRASRMGDQEVAKEGHQLSEHLAVELASQVWTNQMPITCAYHNGYWEISEVNKQVWREASRVTNQLGKVTVTSTNPTEMILKVRDADGAVVRVSGW